MATEEEKKCPCGCGLGYEEGVTLVIDTFGWSREHVVEVLDRFEAKP